MSLSKKELKAPNQYELEFTVDQATFQAAVNAAYKKNAKKINVPGFRPGKAPKHVIEGMYGKGVFYEDAINAVIPAAYEAAVKEAELDTVGQPDIDVVSIEDGVVLKAVVSVKPEVKITGYLGLKAEKKAKRVLKKDIDEELARVRERNARSIEVTDRPAANDDIVNIDYAGSVDGVAFDGGTAQGQTLKLGSGQFIPGFEEQIVGHAIGDEFDVNVSFPTEYHAAELAGKAAVFACKLNGITVSELPALDDEFAKDVSEFDTLDEYKADIKAKLQERNAKAADSEFESKLCEALIDLVDADIPEVMYEAETENFVRDYDNRLRMQGLDLKTYFQYTGMTLEQLREQMKPQAVQQVKLRLALETIAKLENLSAKEEDIEAEYARISQAYNVPLDQVKSMIASEDIAKDMVVKAAMDLVKSKATTGAEKSEKSDEEKPAAKKTTTKTTKAKKAADAE